MKNETIKIERLRDLFDRPTARRLLKEITNEQHICHYNAWRMCKSDNLKNVEYVEGYLNFDEICAIGHAINRYTDENGNVHYFDITQEKHKLFDDTFRTEFEVVKSFDEKSITKIFLDLGGKCELVSVEAFHNRK